MSRPGVLLLTQYGHQFAESRVERILDPQLSRQTPGTMTLVRAVQAKVTLPPLSV
jgi:hypothetical protein